MLPPRFWGFASRRSQQAGADSRPPPQRERWEQQLGLLRQRAARGGPGTGHPSPPGGGAPAAEGAPRPSVGTQLAGLKRRAHLKREI